MPTGRVTRPLILTAALTLLTPAFPAVASAQERAENVRSVGMERRGWRDELRLLGEAIRRVANRGDGFAARLDVTLDGSRHEGSRREDRINATAREFSRAAVRLRDGFDENDYYHSRPSARELLRVATRLDRLITRNSLGSRIKADWNVIGEDLLIVADAYNLDYGR